MEKNKSSLSSAQSRWVSVSSLAPVNVAKFFLACSLIGSVIRTFLVGPILLLSADSNSAEVLFGLAALIVASVILSAAYGLFVAYSFNFAASKFSGGWRALIEFPIGYGTALESWVKVKKVGIRSVALTSFLQMLILGIPLSFLLAVAYVLYNWQIASLQLGAPAPLVIGLLGPIAFGLVGLVLGAFFAAIFNLVTGQAVVDGLHLKVARSPDVRVVRLGAVNMAKIMAGVYLVVAAAFFLLAAAISAPILLVIVPFVIPGLLIGGLVAGAVYAALSNFVLNTKFVNGLKFQADIQEVSKNAQIGK